MSAPAEERRRLSHDPPKQGDEALASGNPRPPCLMPSGYTQIRNLGKPPRVTSVPQSAEVGTFKGPDGPKHKGGVVEESLVQLA